MQLENLVPRKLALLVGVLTFIIAGEWAIGYFAMETLASVRAYARMEGHWSKAQKDAVYLICRYSRTRDPKDYMAYLERLEIPASFRQARLEMLKRKPDWVVLEQSLLRAGNQPQDVDGMARLFIRFRNYRDFQRLLDIWENSDDHILELRAIGRAIRKKVRSAGKHYREPTELIAMADKVNFKLAPLETAFSNALGEAARKIRQFVWQLQTVAFLVFLTLGCWMAFRLSKALSEKEIYRLNRELSRHVRELDASNKELDSFCYSVSHDLRAPLRAMRGFADMLAEGPGFIAGAEGQKLLADLRRNGERMAELLNGLLTFSRMSLQPLELTDIDIEGLARQVVDDLRALETGRAMEISIDALVPSRGDATLVRQVFVNLIGNAIKFTRPIPEARIRLTSWVEPERIVYSVEDNGVGFDEQYAAKLFGVFQRLHPETEFEGTGVGLALVQRIISRHGGSVWAKSKEGAGSTFFFALPR